MNLHQRISELNEQQRRWLLRLLQERAKSGQSDPAKSRRLVGYYRTKNAASCDSDSIKRLLREQLPKYMVPDVVIAVQEFHRLSNGKIDRRRLATIAGDQQTTPTHSSPSTNVVEQNLTQIWKEVIGLENVGVDDNFFAIGGDSILAIQIISRARQAGIQFEPRQFVDHPTIAGLASVAKSGNLVAADLTGASEPFSLLPIQNWFFQLGLQNPNYWNMSQFFELDPSISRSVIEQAIRSCVEHHPMLRARFTRTSNEIKQQVVALSEFELNFVEVEWLDEINDSVFVEAIRQAQSTLDIESGPLFTAVLLASPNRTSRLLLIAHHLVVDAVSWNIIANDLEQACRQIQAGKSVQLPTTVTTYQQWVEAVNEYAQDLSTGTSDGPMTALPADYPDGKLSTEHEARTWTQQIDVDTVHALREQSSGAYNTNSNDLMVAALAMTIGESPQSRRVGFWLERHGRPAEFPETDVTHTVGWFTTSVPFCIELPSNQMDRQEDLQTIIKKTKEELRRLPHDGIASGFEHDLTGTEAGIVFNNLGSRVERDHQLVRPVPGALASSRDSGNRRTHQLEINALVDRDGLKIDWIYCPSIHRPETIRQLGAKFALALGTLIEHCAGKQGTDFSPSDFPDADLDQSELDQFLSDFD